jgi:hypothetical protein
MSMPIDPSAVPPGVTAAGGSAHPGRAASDYEHVWVAAYRLEAGTADGSVRLVDPTGRTLARGSAELEGLEMVAAPLIDHLPRAVRNEAALAGTAPRAVFLEMYRVRWDDTTPPLTFLPSGQPLSRPKG